VRHTDMPGLCSLMPVLAAMSVYPLSSLLLSLPLQMSLFNLQTDHDGVILPTSLSNSSNANFASALALEGYMLAVGNPADCFSRSTIEGCPTPAPTSETCTTGGSVDVYIQDSSLCWPAAQPVGFCTFLLCIQQASGRSTRWEPSAIQNRHSARKWPLALTLSSLVHRPRRIVSTCKALSLSTFAVKTVSARSTACSY